MLERYQPPSPTAEESTSQSPTLAKAALTYSEADDPVTFGRAAWQRLKTGRDWQDWVAVGKALLVGRDEAMSEAKAKKPSGRKYSALFDVWLQRHDFDDINANDRSQLMRLVEQLADVEAWRASLSDAVRVNLNSPSAVWRAWKAENGGDGRRQQEDQAQNGEAIPTASPRPSWKRLPRSSMPIRR
jgi:hypothetical protein